MSKYRSTIIKILVSSGLFYFILSRLDIDEVFSMIGMVDKRYIPVVLMLLISNYLISSFRWKKLLIFENTSSVSMRFLTNLYFVGSFFNNFMPTSIGGDVYKVLRLGKRINSRSNAFSATFMERFTGIVALVLISYLGLISSLDLVVGLFPQSISSHEFYVNLLKVFLFIGFWVGSFAFFIALKLASNKIDKVKGVYDSLLLYKDKRGVLTWALVTSFAVQFMGIFTQYFIFKSLGVDISITFAFLVFPIVTIASFFIPSLNGVGVQDALYVEFFKTVGLTPELSISASILYHLSRLVVSLIGGVIYALEKN